MPSHHKYNTQKTGLNVGNNCLQNGQCVAEAAEPWEGKLPRDSLEAVARGLETPIAL